MTVKGLRVGSNPLIVAAQRPQKAVAGRLTPSFLHYPIRRPKAAPPPKGDVLFEVDQTDTGLVLTNESSVAAWGTCNGRSKTAEIA